MVLIYVYLNASNDSKETCCWLVCKLLCSFQNVVNTDICLSEKWISSEASYDFMVMQSVCSWSKPVANVLKAISKSFKSSMTQFLDTEQCIKYQTNKITPKFRFWWSNFAFRNPNSSLIFLPTAQKKLPFGRKRNFELVFFLRSASFGCMRQRG